MLNRVTMIGRLTRQPELRTTATGKNVVSFGIAVNGRGKDEVSYFTAVAWGQTADYVSNYLTKGRLVAIDGRLSWRKYVTSDGQNREVIEIVADSVQGLDRPKDDAPAPADDEYNPFNEADE